MNLLENVLPKLKLQNPPTDPTERVHKIPVCRILPNPAQPRKYFDSDETLRLADSIRRHHRRQPEAILRGHAQRLHRGPLHRPVRKTFLFDRFPWKNTAVTGVNGDNHFVVARNGTRRGKRYATGAGHRGKPVVIGFKRVARGFARTHGLRHGPFCLFHHDTRWRRRRRRRSNILY